MLGIGACVCVTLAGELAEEKPGTLADSLRFSAPRSELIAPAWSAGDTRLDRGILLAQAEAIGSAPRVFLQADGAGGGASIGVTQEFSSWSDFTAMFRPSRWNNPFREGGALSWLNYNAWAEVPGRTTKVLIGEAIVVLATYAIIDSTGKHHDDAGTTTPVAAPVARSSSGGSPAAAAIVAPSSGGSSSGSSTTGGTTTPPPSTPGNGGEMPW